MKIAAHILDFLKKYGTAEIPGFGTFYSENSPAEIDPESKIILPPSKQIGYKPDYETADEKIIHYISEKENVSSEEVSKELKKTVDYWKKSISEKEILDVSELGIFSNNGDSIHFKGQRIAAESPDFYGLEQINLSEIKKTPATGQKDYSFIKSPVWMVLLLIFAAVLGYLAYTNQEKLFGKNIKDFSSQRKPVPALKKDSLQKDSVTAAADSLTTDTLKTVNTVSFN